MGFGNIALLGGMLLGLLPIIIHLVNKRRARLVRFAAIEFLLLSDKKLARRLKLKQILVLALRVLLIVAMAFALAKPYLEPDQVAGVNVTEPGAVALIIDDSASMNALRPDGTSRFEEVMDEARRLITSRGERTSVAIIMSGAPARLLTRGVTFDEAALMAALAEARPSDRGQDFEGALREAGRVLSEAGETRRQVLVLSDQARDVWAAGPKTWTWAPLTDIKAVPPKEPARLANIAVAQVRVSQDEQSAGFIIEADIKNYGDAEANVEVSLKIGEMAAVEPVTVKAGRVQTATFRSSDGTSRGNGTVSIAPSDQNSLSSDDLWYFTGTERVSLHVLLVNGAPRSPNWLDELFFLRPALALTPPGHPPITTSVVAPQDLTAAQLDAADVVVLANVATVSKEQALAIKHWVERGGGLLTTVGDNLEPATANAAFGDLLPFPIREVKSVGRANDPQSVLQALSLASVDFEHPVFSIFRGLQDASLFKAHVTSYALVDSEGQQGASVIASLTGGVPALVEAPLGRGRVMLWTSSIDRDWSDIALRTSFPPLIQRLASYLGRLLDRTGDNAPTGLGLQVGMSARLPVPDGVGPITVRRPDGVEIAIADPQAIDDDRTLGATIFLENVDVAGHWETMRTGQPDRALVTAVNVDRAESDLTPTDEMTIAAASAVVLQDNGVLPGFGPAEGESESIAAAGVPETQRTVLWPWILAGLFLLFGSEAWLLIRA